jgi:periplasmic divalent cation tolerance protein
MEAGKYSVIFITVPNVAEGTKIAEALVTDKLAACVNQIGGILSLFWWEGKVQRESEVLLMAKTAARNIDKLISRVKELHSYTTPEVIALPIERGNADYLKWIDDVTV